MKKDLELSVTLNTDLPGHAYLVVNGGKHVHEFTEDSEGQGICWTLTGNASHGEFCELEGLTRCLQWPHRQPPEGIFRSHALPARNKFRMLNHHTGTNTRGQWHYQLFARFGDQIYQTPWTSANGASDSSNPTIKNT